MELTGKVILAQPEATGMTGAGKQWRRRTYVLEFLPENNQYERHMAFDVWNDKIDSFQLVEGNSYTISFDVDLRKWQGKSYNNFTAWKVVEAQEQADAAPAYEAPVVPPVNEDNPPLPETPLPTSNSNEELPF